MNGRDSILIVVTSPWPQKSISNIYSSDVAQFKTSFTLVQCLSNWLKSRDCCGLDAPQSVKRCWEGLLWCWANTICFLCLCCFAGLVFLLLLLCLYPSERGQATNHQQRRVKQSSALSPLMMYIGIQGHKHSHTDITAVCTVASLPNAPLLRHREEIVGSWPSRLHFMTPTSYSLIY